MPSGKVTVAVVGATGFTGAETLRWCLGHPELEVVGATSGRQAGKRLDAVWPAFLGHSDLVLTAEPPKADVYFLALPHGEAGAVSAKLRGRVIVDLSSDHRVGHPDWVYGLPEANAERLRGASRIANPGCFATAIALALLPFRGSLPPVVHAVGLTGSTGSGAAPSETTHHPMRAENLRPYKVLAHQHAPEVIAALGGGFALDFVPISAPIRRGILATMPIPGASRDALRAFYEGNPLARVVDGAPDVLPVLGSPRADLGIVAGEAGRAVVFCAIDNLTRGAGSQAVANVNLAMGWPVDLGLRAIPPVP